LTNFRKNFKPLLEVLFTDIKKMDRKDHLLLWIVPFTILSISLMLYFSGNPSLAGLVAPAENWEWGIIENLQALLVLLMAGLFAKGAFRTDDNLIRAAFGLLFIFSVFVFVEEIDYGAHYRHLITGQKESYLDTLTGTYNLHNQGNNAKLFKRPVYGLICLIFLVSPYIGRLDPKNILRKLTDGNTYFQMVIPSPRMALLVAVLVFADLFPRALVFSGLREDGGFGVNIGEFSEFIMYYLFFRYLALIRTRTDSQIA